MIISPTFWMKRWNKFTPWGKNTRRRFAELASQGLWARPGMSKKPVMTMRIKVPNLQMSSAQGFLVACF